MRPYTTRELFLQNLLATSATLLFRSVKALEKGTIEQQEALIIEATQWFLDTKHSLMEVLATPEALPSPAPPAATSGGVYWRAPLSQENINNGTISPGPVSPTPSATEGVAASSNASHGSSTSTLELHFRGSEALSFFMK